MVNPVTPGVSYPTPQPTFAVNEARVNTQQAQPRQAPAAESQRGDQRAGRDETQAKGGTDRAISFSANREAPAASERRGEYLDIVV